MGICEFLPEIINIPIVLNFDKEYLSARQPMLGFASPTATPLTRAAHNIKQNKINHNQQTIITIIIISIMTRREYYMVIT